MLEIIPPEGSGSGGGSSAATPLFRLRASDPTPAGLFQERMTAGTAMVLDNFSGVSGVQIVTGAKGFQFFLGDSLGTGINPVEVEDSWIRKLWRLQEAQAPLHLANLSVNAAQLVHASSAILSVDSIRLNLPATFASLPGVIYVYAGSNDIKLGGQSGATVFSRLTALCTALKAMFPLAKIVVFTLLPRENDATFETQRLATNASMRSAGTTYWDVLIDFGNTSNAWAANAAATLLTQWFTDAIHGTNLLYSNLAALAYTQATTLRTTLGI